MDSYEMHFFAALQSSGYEGSCPSEEHLRQALRFGAASRQYAEIVDWLEAQLVGDREIYACMQPIIMQMRRSYMDRAPQRDNQMRPYQFRYNMLELLVAMLCIRQRRQELIYPFPPTQGVTFQLETSTESIPTQIDSEWVFVDRSKPTGTISQEKFDILLDALVEKFAEEGTLAYLNGIKIEEVKASPGLYKLCCGNFKQVSEVLLAFSLLPLLWKGEDLCLLPWRMYEQFMFSSAWLSIRRPYDTTEDLFDMINKQNGMNIKSLGFLSNEEDDLHLLQMPLREMSFIRQTGGKLKLGSGHIQLLLNKDMGTWIEWKHFDESNNVEA